IRTERLAVEAMIATMTGTILAIILDPIFLFVLKWGATGVGIANILGYVVTDLILVIMILQKARFITLDPKLIKINAESIKEVVAIGIPGSITNFAQSFGMALLNSSLAIYGADKVAAMGITQKIYGIVILVIVGFAFQVVYAVIVGGLLIVFARPVTALFMNQPDIVSAGSYMLLATIVTTPVVGIVLVYTTVFQSVGNAWGAFIMAIARQGVIYFVVLELMKMTLGYHGIVWSQAISDILTCVIGFFIYEKALDLKDKIESAKNKE